jgi:nucleoside-diphosphate-sugar epimerase
LGFVVPDFASQLAAIKLGQQPPTMSVGNLEAQRDFTDVRDVVRAYTLLAEKGQPGQAYLICSGQPVSIHYLLTTLADLAGWRLTLPMIRPECGRRTPPASMAAMPACSRIPAGSPKSICASRWPMRWPIG